ncbi:elongation of very long chain fatty acids protein, putative [Pediculus humanus corporis]|uniref:Elongation of very long chain fatty acids protein n=1 Tax=Pediculus humanus subsp. corporis TaxID=121224 RepID=E0VQR5_PEDHC|nr:elongation of very long chain fatty acids protein, putative [Pediculus humanus corporis]EEB15720.1 elongation of very long chain fatty acids protein, putative [Pediculus humanus corporis]
MSNILYSVIDNYDNVLQSTRGDSWLFMSNPISIFLILVGYLYFVLKLGPELMEKRKPYNMKLLLITYNLYQVLFNLGLASVPIRMGLMGNLFLSVCHRSIPKDGYFASELSRGAWWYFISKVVDLLDTVFFVLRKKQNQVTFLHVYHHTVTCLFSWGYLKYLPGEQGIFIGFLNSSVHVFMYAYYMIAAMGPKYVKYLWWKKYITWIQLVQFCIMLVYLSSLIVLDCQLPKALTFFFTVNVTIFLYLFIQFYRKAYFKKSRDM